MDRVRITLLSAALLLVVALRFLFLDIDPPYGIVSTSGDLISDEGWYAKGAVLKMKFDQWINPHDHNFQIAVPLNNILLSWVFKIVGVHLVAARLVALVAFVMTLFLFYKILRTDFAHWIALLGCLLVAVGIENFAFSRLALTEPIAAFFSIAALSLWIFYPANFLCCLASLALASCAFFEKLLFLHVFGIVVLLWGWDIRQLILQRHMKKAWALIGAILAVSLATAVGFWELQQLSPADWTSMSSRTQEALFSWRHPKGILNPFKTFAELLLRRDTAIPLIISFVGLCVFWYKRHQVKIPASRAFAAMLSWSVLGFLALGINYYHPERYFYFLVFPIVYLSLLAMQQLAPKKYLIPLLLIFLVLQVAWQIPAYVRWAKLPQQNTYVSIAKDIAKTVTEDGSKDVVLMGDISAFVAFFPGQIRPISLAFADPAKICQFIQYWKPSYFIIDSPLDDIVKCYPESVKIVPIKSYTIMNHYYGNDYTLYRVDN